jgi:hypothetical protein
MCRRALEVGGDCSGRRTREDVEELIKDKKETRTRGKYPPRKRADIPGGRMWRSKIEKSRLTVHGDAGMRKVIGSTWYNSEENTNQRATMILSTQARTEPQY